jgi:hypothetical protein
MKVFSKLAMVAAFCALLSGCASIIHGANQAVDITSQPTGATITIDGREYGQTPKSIELRRKGRLKTELAPKKEYAVTIEMDGYFPYEMKIKRELDGWFIGNIILGGLIGIIIDAADGAMYKLTPDQIIAQMGRENAMNIQKSGEHLYIAATLEPDPSWEKIGNLSKKTE